MIKFNEDALICDLAETYQIHDYKQLPPSKIAVFSVGLRDDSRIKMKLNDRKIPLNSILLAGVNDTLNLLLWTKTKDGQKGKNRPTSLTESFTVQPHKEKKELVFTSGEDFEEMRQRLMKSKSQGRGG